MTNYFKILDDKFKNQESINISPKTTKSNELEEFETFFIFVEKLKQDLENQKIKYRYERQLLVKEQKLKMSELLKFNEKAESSLSDISSNLEKLKKSELSENFTDEIKGIEDSLKDIKKNIKSSVDYSKVESGNFKPNFENFNLKHLIFKIHDNMKAQAELKDASLMLIMHDNLWQMYKADEYRIEQVITSIIKNAIDFSNYGNIELEIEQTKRFGSMAEVKFTVRDIGNGVRNDKFSKIFQQVKVKYASNITNDKNEMEKSDFNFIAKLCRYMGGDLKIKSSGFKEGIEFSITLPLEVVNT